MKNFSNFYIFRFAIIMVTAVAVVLSFIALSLSDRQEENIRVEKMKNILAAVNISTEGKDIQKQFDKYITQQYVVNVEGVRLDSVDAFGVDMPKEQYKIQQMKTLKASLEEKTLSPFGEWVAGMSDGEEVDNTPIVEKLKKITNSRLLPVYVCKKADTTFYIVPLQGKGLWGPIWGYVALEDDFNTIYGAYFDHKSETPGLGAEISESWFQANFIGKKIMNGQDEFISIIVQKGGASPSDPHAVDAISGGTITSKGLEMMIYDGIADYKLLFEKLK